MKLKAILAIVFVFMFLMQNLAFAARPESRQAQQRRMETVKEMKTADVTKEKKGLIEGLLSPFHWLFGKENKTEK